MLCLAAVVFCGRLTGQLGIAHAEPPSLRSVSTIGMTVADLDASIRFFVEVLAFEEVSRREVVGDELLSAQRIESPVTRVARLKLGEEQIELTEFVSPKGRPFPEDSRSNDRWFQHVAVIVSDMDKAHSRIHQKMVRHASKDPQRLPDWNKNAAGIKAFYFRDPDGHFLEILEFPPDKGDPKWHLTTDRLFLGIDHTAIVVADTQRSLAYYRDALGLKVVGGGENYGTEQESLNNVPGAHLRITTLRAPAGPGIELLEYLNPRDGRPFPSDSRPNDILHWQTTLISSNAEETGQALKRRGFSIVPVRSDSMIDRPDAVKNVILVHDPDGHAMQVVQE